MSNTYDIESNPGIHAQFWADKGRTMETYTVKSARYRTDDDDGTGYVVIETEQGTGFARPTADVGHVLQPGVEFEMETVNGSLVVGIRLPGEDWLFYKHSDQLAAEHRAHLERMQAERTATLAKNEAEWAAQQAALPAWLWPRLERFHLAGGDHFKLNGWGYELTVCQLAELYVEEDQAAVDEYDDTHGCSGNQHGFAKLLAQLHTEGRDHELAHDVPAALSPITGSADYS